MFDTKRIAIFVANTIEALNEKAVEPNQSHLASIANQLAKDAKINLNRAFKLASKMVLSKNLNVKF